MLYNIRFAKKQDSRSKVRQKQKQVRGLGQLETREIRAGQVRQRHMSYEIMRPMETTTRTQGSSRAP
jgi:hypothetical protein